MDQLISHKFLLMADGDLHMFLNIKLIAVNSILPFGYVIKVHYQVIMMFFIACLMGVTLTYMLFYLYFKSKREKKHDKWLLISDLLIRKAVFYDEDDETEDDDATIPVTARATKLMRNRYFRELLTKEIMSAKRSISGASADNLKHLYQQLKLDKYALISLKSRYWHIKGKAIQELTVMEMDEFATELYPYTNNQNELVRMEAQTALVQFHGFEGLRFLDIVTYPISDWQQIKLLQQLSLVPPSNISIDAWLKSTNNSVVVFALKLARNYHRFELHDNIVSCLDHEDPEVRLHAIHCLCEIYTDETSDQLVSRFLNECFKNQLTMVKAFQNIGSEKDILFLSSLLNNDNDEMKLCAARALAHSGSGGLISLEDQAKTGGYPLNEMVLQIKGELKA
ncbi:MAG: hypothetical protein JWQ66_2245 [Mucilaginibacter sp.]|nr:hypothetical protein [Mucilaginibacter sp.]